MMPSFSYARAKSVEDAVFQLASTGARVHAGGTDLLGCLRDRVLAADKVVSISGIDALRGIATTADGSLRIGALVTLAEIARHNEIAARYLTLAEAAGAAASPQLRNQGTLGGNLCQKPRCWYYRGEFACTRKGGETCFALHGDNRYHAVFGADACVYVHPSDCAPALVALEALVRIAGPGGTRVVPAERFWVLPAADPTRETVLEPGEIVTEVVLPPPGKNVRGRYRKVRARGVWDFALASIAVALTVEGPIVRKAALVLGGVAPIPWRAVDAEKTLAGKKLDAASVKAAAAAATRGATPMSPANAYKLDLVRGAVEEALASLL
jgi:xanthine dehydrogenase YagS FAD-binding subunit